MFDSREKAGERLGILLDQAGFLVLMQAARAIARSLGPWLSYRELSAYADRVGGTMSTLLRLLALGEEVPRAAVASFLDGALLKVLESAQILADAGTRTVSMDGRAFAVANGLMLLADVPRSYPTRRRKHPEIYVGQDSTFLANLLLGIRTATAIDICTGAGLLALAAARSGATVTATEISPAAAAAARFNAALNGLADRVSVHTGSFLKPLEPRPTDLVFANPPFVALPDRFRGALFADGGSDGFGAVREILGQLPPFLAPDGRALVLGGCYWGIRGYNASVQELRQLAEMAGWRVTLFALEKQPIHLHARLASTYVTADKSCRAAILDDAQAQGWTHFVVVLLEIVPGAKTPAVVIVDGVPALDRIREAHRV